MTTTTDLGRKKLTERTELGFWIYLMTDCVLFATLFATYAVLVNGVAAGPSGKEIFDLPFVMGETVILLTSSFLCGLAVIAAKACKTLLTLGLLAATMSLGIAFLCMEISEFHTLIAEGNSWQTSAFLSAFFALVGTHGVHVLAGLLWAAVIVAVIAKKGLTDFTTRRLRLFALFWHFLDVIWIFVFTIVYLKGAL